MNWHCHPNSAGQGLAGAVLKWMLASPNHQSHQPAVDCYVMGAPIPIGEEPSTSHQMKKDETEVLKNLYVHWLGVRIIIKYKQWLPCCFQECIKSSCPVQLIFPHQKKLVKDSMWLGGNTCPQKPPSFPLPVHNELTSLWETFLCDTSPAKHKMQS